MTGARFSEGRLSQCISNITEPEIILGEDTGNTWLKIISKVRATFLYLRHYQKSQSESRKSERLQYLSLTPYSFLLGVLLTIREFQQTTKLPQFWETDKSKGVIHQQLLATTSTG